MYGKAKCELLRDIRNCIAEANKIRIKTTRCKAKGDCLGTCHKCEKELNDLCIRLMKKQERGIEIINPFKRDLAAILVDQSRVIQQNKIIMDKYLKEAENADQY